MKYLKLFESNEYYEEIMYSEYLSYFYDSERNRRLVDITRSEKIQISNLLDDRFSKSLNDDSKIITIHRKDWDYEIFIRKLEDDWYLVHSSKNDHRCDQWEGVLLCLKNEYGIE